MESIMQTGMKREVKVDKQLEQREDEHLELISWILEQQEWESDFMLIKGEEYNRFMQSDDEDDIMDMKIVECDEFYVKFKEITGVNLMNIENFISMTYIDDVEIKRIKNSDNKIISSMGI